MRKCSLHLRNTSYMKYITYFFLFNSINHLSIYLHQRMLYKTKHHFNICVKCNRHKSLSIFNNSNNLIRNNISFWHPDVLFKCKRYTFRYPDSHLIHLQLLFVLPNSCCRNSTSKYLKFYTFFGIFGISVLR